MASVTANSSSDSIRLSAFTDMDTHFSVSLDEPAGKVTDVD